MRGCVDRGRARAMVMRRGCGAMLTAVPLGWILPAKPSARMVALLPKALTTVPLAPLRGPDTKRERRARPHGVSPAERACC